MIIGTRLKQLREERNLSQSEVERRAGLERCYIERVESGHAVPSVTTLERLAEALELPLYQLFYDQDKPPLLPNLSERRSMEELVGNEQHERGRRFCQRVKYLLKRIS